MPKIVHPLHMLFRQNKLLFRQLIHSMEYKFFPVDVDVEHVLASAKYRSIILQKQRFGTLKGLRKNTKTY